MNKLAEIQSKTQVPKENFHLQGKFKFRSLEDILEKLKPILHADGYYVTFDDKVEALGGKVYITSQATITDGENTFSATAVVREDESAKNMSNPQLSGAAMSYARKYALQGLLALDDGIDADATSDTVPKESKLMITQGSSAWKKALDFLSKGGDITAIKAKYELTATQEAELKEGAVSDGDNQ